MSTTPHEPGRTAYEARFAGQTLGPRGVAPAWEQLPNDVRAVWRMVEDAVALYRYRYGASTPAAPTSASEAVELREREIEALAEHLHEERDYGHQWTWPTHSKDDGYRGNGGYVSITPPDVQARLREEASRILIRVDQLRPAALARPVAEEPAAPVAEEALGVLSRFDVIDFVTRYTFSHGYFQHTPSDFEKELLNDFGNDLLATIGESLAAPKANGVGTGGEGVSWDEAVTLARRAIYDTDGRGMIAPNRNYLQNRVAREIFNATRAPTPSQGNDEGAR